MFASIIDSYFSSPRDFCKAASGKHKTHVQRENVGKQKVLADNARQPVLPHAAWKELAAANGAQMSAACTRVLAAYSRLNLASSDFVSSGVRGLRGGGRGGGTSFGLG